MRVDASFTSFLRAEEKEILGFGGIPPVVAVVFNLELILLPREGTKFSSSWSQNLGL